MFNKDQRDVVRKKLLNRQSKLDNYEVMLQDLHDKKIRLGEEAELAITSENIDDLIKKQEEIKRTETEIEVMERSLAATQKAVAISTEELDKLWAERKIDLDKKAAKASDKFVKAANEYKKAFEEYQAVEKELTNEQSEWSGLAVAAGHINNKNMPTWIPKQFISNLVDSQKFVNVKRFEQVQ